MKTIEVIAIYALQVVVSASDKSDTIVHTSSAQELLGVLRRVEARGRNETVHRVRSLAGRIFRFAVTTGCATHDVAADLKDALAGPKRGSGPTSRAV